MNDALLLGVLSLALTVVAGYPAVALLRRLKVGKEIGEDLQNPVAGLEGEAPRVAAEHHAAKAGTPTMGGLLFLAVITAVTVAFNLFGRYSIAAPLGIMGAFALLGFLDDLGSLQGREQRALNKRIKLAAFIAIGAASAYGLSELLEISHSVNVPWDRRRDLGDLYLLIVLGTVVLTAGGVAVTDGLDGLVAGTGALAYAAYGVIALLQGQDYLGAFCFTVAGALIGFIWHNSFPARVIMGDTGALAIGGGLAIVAFMTSQWLILPIIGAVFVADGASSYLQIGYFKLTGGRRIFRMAPLHHHFEESGWSEIQVVQRVWAAGAAGAALGIVLATEAW
jgi:phospho-N-acetylmuramoyl-pentapeptide-transferase